MTRYLVLAVLALAACRRADETPIADSVIASAGDSVAIDTPVSTPGDSIAEKTCGINRIARLDEDGIGQLKQGRTVAEVAQHCEIISDSQQRGTEGAMERIVVVRIASEIVRSIVVDDRIFRIEINTPRFRTSDSLGVDTPLRRISAMRGAQFAPGEDGVYGFSPEHCGLSFRFSVPLRPPAGGQWTAARIEAEHGDAAVNRVIVIPCRR